jgi:TPR repeat protein
LGLLLARTGRENEALKYLAVAAKQGDSDAAYNAGAVCQDTDPRKHATVDARLNAVRDLAVFLATERGTTD